MKTTITLTAGGADLVLEVEYEFQKGCKQTWEQPGESDHVVVNSVVLEEVDETGVYLISTPVRVLEIIGQMCLDAHDAEINRRTYEAHCEQGESDACDRADMERDRRRDEPRDTREELFRFPKDVD